MLAEPPMSKTLLDRIEVTKDAFDHARHLLLKAQSKLRQQSRFVMKNLMESVSSNSSEESSRATVNRQYYDLPEDEGTHERWTAVLDGRNSDGLTEEDLSWLIDTGMPLKERHKLWPRWWSGVGDCEVDALQGNVLPDIAQAIERDLARTLPACLTAEDQDILRRVLFAFSLVCPETGYCQGLSFLVAVPLLLGFSEQQAFQCLRFITQDVCPSYHGPFLQGYVTDLAVLSAFVSLTLPEINDKLEEMQISMDMLAADHLLTLSSRTWPLLATVRLWDIVLMEGSPALLASFLATLDLYFLDAIPEEYSDPGDVASRFRDLTCRSVSHDIDELIHRTRKFLPLIRGDPVNQGLRGAGHLLDWFRSEVIVVDDV